MNPATCTFLRHHPVLRHVGDLDGIWCDIDGIWFPPTRPALRAEPSPPTAQLRAPATGHPDLRVGIGGRGRGPKTRASSDAHQAAELATTAGRQAG